MKQTAVEWLAEKYNYIIWMRNRDEISPVIADEWRKDFLNKAKEIEKQQIIDAFNEGTKSRYLKSAAKLGLITLPKGIETGEQYYNETFKREKP